MGVGGWDLERKECGLGGGWAVRTQKPSCLRNQVKAPVTLLVKELAAFVHIAPPHPILPSKRPPSSPGCGTSVSRWIVRTVAEGHTSVFVQGERRVIFT